MKFKNEVEQFRILTGLGRSMRNSPFGAFKIDNLFIMANDGAIDGWEHVSVSTPIRCPTWEEMCMVKDLFWADDETVMQFFPKKDEYVNNHPFCLHMWKKRGENAQLPPSILVGLKNEDFKLIKP